MKKSLFTFVISIIIIGILLISCKPSTKEEIEAKESLIEAKDNAKKASVDLLEVKRAATKEEWNEFKQQTDSAIRSNEARIADLKIQIKKTSKSIDASYDRKIDTLQQKNAALKVKLITYKNDTHADWDTFKQEFKDDMNELGQALKGLTVDSKK